MDILINAKVVQEHTLGAYRYFVSSIFPHKSASLVIILLDTSRNEVQRLYKVIEGEEYAGWGSDDTYLDELVEKEVKKVVIVDKPILTIETEEVVLDTEEVVLDTEEDVLLSSNIIDE